MPWQSAPMQRLRLAVALLLIFSFPVAAGQEPYRENIMGWRFTQDIVNRMALCRAFSPAPASGVIIWRRGDGQYTISVPAPNVPRGMYEEASFEVGREAEPVNARADGNRVYIPVDDDMMGRVQRAGGFRWAVNRRRQVGHVQFNIALGPVVTRLRECTRANGGR